MKLLNVLCAAAGLAFCLQTATASAQTPIALQPSQGTGITVDQLALVCSLLPQDMARICYDELTYSNNSAALEESNRMLVQFCQSLSYSDDRAACYARRDLGFYSAAAIGFCSKLSYASDRLECLDSIRNNNFQQSALKMCSNLSYATDRIACLGTIANNYYAPNALGVCSNLSYAADRLSCLNVILNREFQDYEIQACNRESYASSRIACLKTFGRYLDYHSVQVDPYGRDSRRQDEVIVVVPQQQQQADTCQVVNSSGNLITDARVPVDQFLEAARGYAASIGKCVISEIKGVQKSSAVFSRNGEVIDYGLSQDKAAAVAKQLRQRSGESSCARVNCQ